MISQTQALPAAIKAAIAERHRTLLLNGYDLLERLSQQLDDIEYTNSLKTAAGQDWAPYEKRAPNPGINEIHDDLCEICAAQVPEMIVLSVIPGFDSKQRWQWAVTYSLRYGDFMYSIAAKLSQWSEPNVRILGWPYSRQTIEDFVEEEVDEFNEDLRDEAIQKLQNLIYEQITKMHERHLAYGYSHQKKAYERFLNASASQGYLVSGSERFQAVSTEASFREEVDPDCTEEAFRDSWALPMSQISLLTAEYFPTEEGLDRWYVVYQLSAPRIILNIFVKFYPHRRPQVEIVSS